MAHAEQIDKATRRSTRAGSDRAYEKRRAARLRRRLERIDPENVPPRVTAGWCD